MSSECSVSVCGYEHYYFLFSLSQVCVCGCMLHRLKEDIPSIYTMESGFETIAEYLNVLRGGHLCVVATKEIPPCTEVVMDYFIQRHCFHSSGTCPSHESPAFQTFQYSLFLLLNCFVSAFFLICYTREALLSRAVREVL